MNLTQKIVEKFSQDIKIISGTPESSSVSAVSSEKQPQSGTLVYCSNEDGVKKALQAKASFLVIPTNLAESDTTINLVKDSDALVASTPEVQVIMALINQSFFTAKNYKKTFGGQASIHPSATIAASVKIGKNVVIGPGVVIDDDCEIGESTYIGANSVIEAGCKIGSNSHIAPLVFIGHDCFIGNHCKIQSATCIGTDGFGYGTSKKGIHHFKPHLGKVVLEDHVDIGAGVYIDRGTFDDSIIGEGSKIDNHAHLAHNFVMGKHCLVAGGFNAAGSATVGNHCVIGGRVTLNGHTSITDQVMVGGLSGVEKNLTEPGKYAGYPIQPLKNALRTLVSLPNLPEMRKTIGKLKKLVEKS